jgi:hypothetical protein
MIHNKTTNQPTSHQPTNPNHHVSPETLQGCIVYWIAGLNPSAAAFFIFVGIIILAGLTSQALGVAVSAGAPNEKVALAIAPSITVILILFGGFYANAETSECRLLP